MDATYSVFIILLIICAYTGQYWAFRCHKELKALREELARRNDRGGA